MLVKRHWRPILIAAVFLLIAASRIVRLPNLEPDIDEVWSVWQTFGTPRQIIEWTPYNWQPLHPLAVGAWKGLVGINPFMVRLLSVYVFMIGGAFVYRVARRLHGDTAAFIATTAYGAFGFGLTISTWIRGYVFILTLTPLALWLTLRYFERPTIRRGGILGLCIATMFYTHATGVLALGIIGLYTLIVYRRASWRWWLPISLAVILALPEVIDKLKLTVERASSVTQIPIPPALPALSGMYASFAGWGATVMLWAALFLIATALILYHNHKRPGAHALALIIWMLMPVVMYILLPVVGTFSESHLVWAMIGVVIWLGWGLSYLPRSGVIVASALLAAAMFWPFHPDSRLRRPTLDTSLHALASQIEWGDVMVIDPYCGETVGPEEWDYYVRVYFPNGLRVVINPDGYRRVWYVKIDGRSDPETEKQIHQNRVAGQFFGPWYFLFRLYEAPPDTTGIPFENGLRFHGSEIIGPAIQGMPVYRESETVRVRLWWSVDRPVERDYSIGLYVLDWRTGEILVQSDGAPFVTDAPQATSQWLTGRYYIEERDLHLPNPTGAGRHSITLAVYQWWDNVRIAAPGVDTNRTLIIQKIVVVSS